MTQLKTSDIEDTHIFTEHIEKGRYNFLVTPEPLTDKQDKRNYTLVEAFDHESNELNDELAYKLKKIFDKAPFDSIGFVLIFPDGRLAHMDYIPMGNSVN